jgi:hypothetical protein
LELSGLANTVNSRAWSGEKASEELKICTRRAGLLAPPCCCWAPFEDALDVAGAAADWPAPVALVGRFTVEVIAAVGSTCRGLPPVRGALSPSFPFYSCR